MGCFGKKIYTKFQNKVKYRNMENANGSKQSVMREPNNGINYFEVHCGVKFTIKVGG